MSHNKEKGSSTTLVKKTTKVDSKKTTAEAKVPVTENLKVKSEAKSKNLKTLLPGVELDTSLFITKPRGGAKGHDLLFREGIINATTETAKRSQRRQIRVNIEKFEASFAHYKKEKDNPMLKKLKASFDDYYAKVYLVNDYTVESIAGANVKAGRKERLQEMFSIIKGIK